MIEIKDFQIGMEKEIHQMVLESAMNNIRDDLTAEGENNLRRVIKPNYIKERFEKGLKTVVAVDDNNKIVGFLQFKTENHIMLFFIKSNMKKQGIGRKLFNFAMKSKSEEKFITVNSATGAVGFYEKLGFFKITEKMEKDGISFVTMKNNLGCDINDKSK